MLKRYLLLITTLCFIAPAAMAEGFYAGAGIGIVQAEDDEGGVEFDDSSFGWRILAGYEINENFAVEGAYLVACWGLAAGSKRRGVGWAVALLPVGYLMHGLWDLRHAFAATAYAPSGYPEVCVAYDWLLVIYFLTRLPAWSRA